jgi:predicted DNA-binding transcriptional regulator AlpA
LGKGPKFLKIGARVLYREEDVEAWEAAQVCQNTSGPLPSEGL